MKHSLLIVSFASFAIQLQAQDLIVTSKGDSINCKITKVKSDNIYFVFKYKEEIRNTLLPVNQVAIYQKNYYSTAEVPANKIPGKEIYPRFRAAISGGWSYRTASISSSVPSDFKNYMQKLRSGFHYDLGVSYFFSEMLGAGIRYNEFLSSNKIENVYATYPDGSTEYGYMNDDIRIKFIGPSFCLRLFNSTKKNYFFSEIALGYMDYRDKGFLVNTPLLIKGSTSGSCMSIGYDIGISKNLALGFQLSALTGVLNRLTTTDGTFTQTTKLDEYENLARIDLSIGLRFNR